jgi:predicted nucleic acid-binding protein
MTGFVDANIFLRLLARDDPSKTQACLELFQRARRGEVNLHTSEAIVAEVIYVLLSPKLYGRSRAEIAAGLGAVIGIRGVHIPVKSSVLAAIDVWQQTGKLDFADCLAVAHAPRDHDGAVYSYDRAIGSIEGVQRLEPDAGPEPVRD